VEEGIPFVMASDIRNRRVEIDSAKRLPQAITDRLRIGFSYGGDVLLSHKGSVGYVAIAPDYVPYMMLTPQVTYYRVNEEKLSRDFLCYAFREPGFQKRLANAAGQQGTRGYVGITAQRKLTIQYGDRALQDRLVHAIKPYDDLIEINQRRIALLEEAARFLYREWFVNFRFPGHEHVKTVNGLPDGWERTTASTVVDVLSGGTPKTDKFNYWNGEIGFFTPKDATSTPFVLETEKTITEEGLRACNSQLYPADTVFITARGTVGKLNLALVPMAMNQSCYALRSKSYLGQRYIYLALKAAIEQIRSKATGAVFDAIIVATFDRIPFLLPSQRFTDAFSLHVDPMFDQIANLVRQNQKLAQARDLLLPRLMNGDIAA
jgi:type I restriction enzyme S subunit